MATIRITTNAQEPLTEYLEASFDLLHDGFVQSGEIFLINLGDCDQEGVNAFMGILEHAFFNVKKVPINIQMSPSEVQDGFCFDVRRVDLM